MPNRGRHTSVNPGLKLEVAWLESLPEVARVILGRTEPGGHSFGVGTLRVIGETAGGIKIRAYGAGTITEIFVIADKEKTRKPLMQAIEARYPESRKESGQEKSLISANLNSNGVREMLGESVDDLAALIPPPAMDWRALGTRRLRNLLKKTELTRAELAGGWNSEFGHIVSIVGSMFKNAHQYGEILLLMLGKFDDPKFALWKLRHVLEDEMGVKNSRKRRFSPFQAKSFEQSMQELPDRHAELSDQDRWMRIKKVFENRCKYESKVSPHPLSKSAAIARRGGLESERYRSK